MWPIRFCDEIEANGKILTAYLIGLHIHSLMCEKSVRNIRKMAETSFYNNLIIMHLVPLFDAKF